MAASIVPAKTAFSRVFIIEGGARADRKPSFEAYTKAGGLEWGVGDVERIEAPDPEAYGDFIEIGEVIGQVERPTISLTSRFAMDIASKLLSMARRRCPGTVHIHFGQCTDPTSFNDYTKAIIVDPARPSNYSTEDLGALGSDENAKVDETLDLSGKDAYEVLPLSVGEKAASLITNEIMDVTIADVKGCGDCADESDGSEKIYAVSKAAGGSPSTPPDVIYTLDKGATWGTSDIDSLSSAQDAVGIRQVGQYLVAISDDVGTTGNLNYVLKTDLDLTGDETWVGVTTGFVAGKQPRAISVAGGVGFIVGNGGYIYKCIDPTAGVEVLDAGGLTSDDLLSVHALSEDFVVACGNNGIILYTTNGQDFSALTRFTALGVHFNAIWAKNTQEWFVVTSSGLMYYTVNGGVTWTAKTFPGSGTGVCYDILFVNSNVGYLAHTNATPKGRILRSTDGGYSWVVTPERLGLAGIPTNQRLTCIAANRHDVNFYVAGGLGLSTDGILIQAQD